MKYIEPMLHLKLRFPGRPTIAASVAKPKNDRIRWTLNDIQIWQRMRSLESRSLLTVTFRSDPFSSHTAIVVMGFIKLVNINVADVCAFIDNICQKGRKCQSYGFIEYSMVDNYWAPLVWPIAAKTMLHLNKWREFAEQSLYELLLYTDQPGRHPKEGHPDRNACDGASM